MNSTALADTHCHLQDAAFDVDRAEVIARALHDLAFVVVIGDDLDTSEGACALLRDRLYAAVGVHPYHAEGFVAHKQRALDRLRTLARRPGVVAIGEIGMDYYKYCPAPPSVQREAFAAQLELASELGLPVVIHNRDAHQDIEAVLRAHAPRLSGGILHCFSGDLDFLKRGLDWGFNISFAGNVTFKKAEDLREAARQIPLDRLLVETDSPYLAPQPVRGKRCEPVFIQHTAACIAGIRGLALDELAQATTLNAKQLFAMA